MTKQSLYLLPLLLLLAACSQGSKEIKQLYPKRVVIGGTTHEFHYDQGRVYSVTTSRSNFYEAVTYQYHDEYFNEPDILHKDKIFQIVWEPDAGTIGWDRSDSVLSKKEWLIRSDETGLLARESYFVRSAKNRQDGYIRNYSRHNIIHQYNSDDRLTETNHYYENESAYNLGIAKDDPRYLYKQVKYSYKQGKLQKMEQFAPVAPAPYLTIELEYDDKSGYLRSLPLEARFMPLELPSPATTSPGIRYGIEKAR